MYSRKTLLRLCFFLQTCRSKLGGEHCYESTESVEDWWPLDINYSRTTCELLQLDNAINCTLLDYYGMKSTSDHDGSMSKPDCNPLTMRQASYILWSVKNPIRVEERVNLKLCKHLCEEEHFTFSRSSGPLNESKLLDLTSGAPVGYVNRSSYPLRLIVSTKTERNWCYNSISNLSNTVNKSCIKRLLSTFCVSSRSTFKIIVPHSSSSFFL